MSYDSMQDAIQPADGGMPPEGGPDETALEFDPAFVDGGKKPFNRGPVMLAGLLLVGAVVIWFMYFHQGPANSLGGTSPNDAGEQIRKFLDKGNINMMMQTLKETEKIVHQFRSYDPGKAQIPLASLRSNPFRELPPKSDAPITGPTHDDDRDADFHKQAIEAVAELHLQSVIHGKRPACMINNTFYRAGDQLAGMLTIEKINSSTVELSAGRYRFELKMSH